MNGPWNARSHLGFKPELCGLHSVNSTLRLYTVLYRTLQDADNFLVARTLPPDVLKIFNPIFSEVVLVDCGNLTKD